MELKVFLYMTMLMSLRVDVVIEIIQTREVNRISVFEWDIESGICYP